MDEWPQLERDVVQSKAVMGAWLPFIQESAQFRTRMGA
jgi:hypothetical protein